MVHKCYISFKTEDSDYKKDIQSNPDVDMIDKSLDESIRFRRTKTTFFERSAKTTLPILL